MVRNEHAPIKWLSEYIDVYWELRSESNLLVEEKVIPDGCIDLVFNLGSSFDDVWGGTALKPGRTYIAGAITSCKYTTIKSGTHLIGVRFKPGGFSCFFKDLVLKESRDTFIEAYEIPTNLPLKISEGDTLRILDSYFSNGILKQEIELKKVINYIDQQKGNVRVENLTKNCFITARTLERKFNQTIGLSPKEYINIVRNRFALKLIQTNPDKEPLLNIALKCGYYDNAHLTNEIKKYTGTIPSILV